MVENARRLALQTTASSVIPALKDSTGEWRRSAGEKANVFAKTFAEKFILPGMTPNEYSDLQIIRPRATVQQVSADSAHRVLMKLNEDSATGPDLLPTRILKFCADALCDPVSQLVQSILRWGQWPSAWRLHWIVPLHKKKSIYDAGNYRGVHLTPQISKVAERMLLVSVQQVIEDQCLFGENQFAYTKGKGSRDALAMLVMTWIASLNKNRKVAIFCSDVKGAFDHVRLSRMTEKLEATGLPRDMVQVLVSWLAQRDAQVIVEGDFSEKMCLSNMVFQGTVLGPILWNLFFADAQRPIRDSGFSDIIFADDLNAYREYASDVDNEDIMAACDVCQEKLHRWGEANSVAFDPAKETKHVLSRTNPSGEGFKILGVLFDPKLIMGGMHRRPQTVGALESPDIVEGAEVPFDRGNGVPLQGTGSLLHRVPDECLVPCM